MRGRVARFVAPGMVRLAEVDVGDPGPGEVLVKTSFSGISSGTEMLVYRGEIDGGMVADETLGALSVPLDYPIAFGYSCVGEVLRSNDTGIGEGTQVFAFHPHQDMFRIASTDVVALDGEDPRQATLLPLVETALQVTRDAPRTDTCVVIGLGVLGILTGAILTGEGVRVIGTDPCDRRRLAASAYDIETVEPYALAAAVAEATAGAGVELVIDASGDPRTVDPDMRLLAHEGTVLVASWFGNKRSVLSLGREFHRRRLTIRSTQVSTRDADYRRSRREEARGLLSCLPLQHLATHTFPFEEAEVAYRSIARGDPDLIHAALDYA
jgi:2-desacetyl-2-hydroxyethyl bacteriochlorophyllide A dehydrogenase